MLRWCRRLLCVVFAGMVLLATIVMSTGTEAAYAITSLRTRLAFGIDRQALTLNWQRLSWDQTPGLTRLNDPDFIGTGSDRVRAANFSLPGLRVVCGHSETNFSVNLVDPSVDETSIVLSQWLLAGSSAAALLLLLKFERHTPANGRCVRCDYDLRETPLRCPECGQVAA